MTREINIGFRMAKGGDELAQEIRLFEDNLSRIDFHPDVKSSFLAHLVFCYSVLVSEAPKNSIPELTIG